MTPSKTSATLLPSWRLSFTAYADWPVFMLRRKRARMMARDAGRPLETQRRRIVAVRPAPSVPVRCISVQSPNHLFLAGWQMVPTHNTESGSNWLCYIVHHAPGPVMAVWPTMALAKRFEGFHRVPKSDPLQRAHPYRCPAGYMSIGFGHLCDAQHVPITMAEAEVYLEQDLRVALNPVQRYCPVLAIEPEDRLAAIVDFTFNLGAGRLQTSTLRRRVNHRDWIAAASELRRWVYGGGRVLPGLVARREAEVQLLLRV